MRSAGRSCAYPVFRLMKPPNTIRRHAVSSVSPNTCFWPSRNNETIRALAITSGTNPFLITTTTSAKDAITIFSFGLLQGNFPVGP